MRVLETEGWPQPRREDRVGRPLGRQRVCWTLDAETVTVSENGRLYYSGRHGLDFAEGYLYLELSSHNNYRARSVLFDDVRISRGEPPQGR